jgi:hypothetical protein
MDPRLNPRVTSPHIHKIKVKNIGYYKKINLYDNFSSDLLIEIQYFLETNGHVLRRGDIIIETDIQNTVFFKDIIRSGMVIFDGKNIQYLDRTLNKSGTLPCNFTSCTDFKIGYWDQIFNDNIVWLKPNPKFNTNIDAKSENSVFTTEDYQICVPIDQFSFFTQLMNLEFSILVIKDSKNNLSFNIKLFNIYHINLNNDIKNVYNKEIFSKTLWSISKNEKPSKNIWKCTYKELYNIKDKL